MVLAVGVVVTGVVAFGSDAGGHTPEAVDYDDVVEMGAADSEIQRAQHADLYLPRAQVFYSQYRYVVGYTGLDSMVLELKTGRHERSWGRPLHAYVTDFAGTDPRPVEGGFEANGTPSWRDADEVVYVVDGSRVLPLSSESEAEGYAERHGGEVVDIEQLIELDFPLPEVYDEADEALESRRETGDERVDAVETYLEREVEVEVEPNGSIQRAVDGAEPNSTVVVHEGVYREQVEVDRPVTLEAEGDVVLDGGGEGTPLKLTANASAVSGFSVRGVGDELRGARSADGAHEAEADVDGDDGGWDRTIEEAYGSSDAGVRVEARDVLLDDVDVESPSTGVLLLDADDTVIRGFEFEGADDWGDGFMGVSALRSSVVVDNSSFEGGRDSVYLHDADEAVVRDSEMRDSRFGVHVMYSSGALVDSNEVRDTQYGGLVLMTRPSDNYVVANDVRRTPDALITAGARSYFADNVLVNNRRGINMGTRDSVYARNVVAHNEMGARASSIVPSNHVVENDFVENDVQVTASRGAMRIWSADRGNYWSDAPPEATSYRPTAPVDSRVTSVDGAVSLHRSPALRATRSLEARVPGMKNRGVLDLEPLDDPVRYDEVDVEDDGNEGEPP